MPFESYLGGTAEYRGVEFTIIAIDGSQACLLIGDERRDFGNLVIGWEIGNPYDCINYDKNILCEEIESLKGKYAWWVNASALKNKKQAKQQYWKVTL